MKKIVKIYLLMISALLASCLEDDKAPLDPSGSQNIIEFLDPSVPASPAGAIYPAYASSFSLSPQDQFEVVISYSGPNGNSRDIELALTIDPIALEEYNVQMEEDLHGTTYDLMPAENYSISTMSVTIPKGQTKVVLPITVYPDKFDFSSNYAIPLRIASASYGTLSAHFSVAILAVGARNQYDGIYEITGGSITRHQAAPDPDPDPVLSGNYVEDLELSLSTLSSNSVAFEPLWKDGSGVGGVEGTSITIDPATNEVTVVSSTNDGLHNTVGEINRYDPDTKEFTINIDWGTGSGLRVIEDLKLKYVGPRP